MDLSVVPQVAGSLSPYVAACQKILDAHDVKYALHAYGTNIEGDWDTVFKAVKACHEKIHDMGAPRITTTIKLGTRTDRKQGIDDKIKSVQEKL